MINLKKIVAVSLAATMCMGLSMTTFATTLPNQDNATTLGTDSGSAGNGLQQSGFDELNKSSVNLEGTVLGKDKDGNDFATSYYNKDSNVTVKGTNGEGELNAQLTLNTDGIKKGSTAWNSVNSVEEIADILAENGVSVPKGTEIIAIAAGVVNGLSDEQANVLTFKLAEGVDFSTDPYDNTKYHAGDEVWAMFETGENTGVWEMRSGIVNDNGEVDFDVDHKGGFILVKTMKNGRIVAIEKDEQGDEKPPVVIDPTNPDDNKTPSTDKPGTSNKPAAGAATTGTSPKTGEF